MNTSDAGVAGCALYNSAARAELAFSLCIAHDAQRGAVFDRATGVHELGFAQYLAAGRVGQMIQTYQRGMPDFVCQGWKLAHRTIVGFVFDGIQLRRHFDSRFNVVVRCRVMPADQPDVRRPGAPQPAAGYLA